MAPLDTTKSMTRINAVGVPVDAIPSLEVITAAMLEAYEARRPWLMSFANPATAVAIKRFPQLRPILERFDLVAPDGSGMAVAMRLLHAHPAMRVSFDDTSLAPVVF